MKLLTLEKVEGYELIDSGDKEKLERFGSYVLSRPDPNAIWPKKMPQSFWNKADAIFHKEKLPSGKHWENKNVKEPWQFSYESITLNLYLTPFKHTGVFPEQILNWQWIGEILKNKKNCNLLNLFGYTGGATLYAASKGAKVTHVDASRPAVTWARENQKLSNLDSAPIRWIVDDAIKFVSREIKRGHKYNAVIMDPPAFGRDQKGKVFKFEKDIPKLLNLIKQVITPEPLFFIFNSYSLGYSSVVIKNMLSEILPEEKIEFGELHIREKSSKRSLPCGVFARYKNK
jgi:23S rRNA (cytosine1962-C5)-methyltransferase